MSKPFSNSVYIFNSSPVFSDLQAIKKLKINHALLLQISEKFQTKLLKFKTEKLNILKMKMESDIFYDNTVYTGSAGLALLYFLESLKNDNNPETLKVCLVVSYQNTIILIF